MSIRAASAADAPYIAEIYAYWARESVLTVDVDRPPSREEWDARLDTAARYDYPALVAQEAGSVRGYALLSPWIPKPAFRHTVENSIYLAPDAVGQGLGRRLLSRLLDEAVTQGIREVLALIADAQDEGRASRTLHLRAGFEPVGQLRRVGYKHGRWIDVEIHQRTLHQ